MKNKKSTDQKKLSLHRESLRRLEGTALRQVAGGMDPSQNGYKSCYTTCYYFTCSPF